MTAKTNFVRQQGFPDASAESCGHRFPALMWQPRIVGPLALIGLVLQNGPYFLALSAPLWWSVLVPRLNPFDALYNRIVARPKGLPELPPAPPPRRFAQGIAATFMLAIGVALRLGANLAAWILQAFLVVALSALLFGRFCLGSYLFHLFTGNAAFANRTLPWARGD